MQHVKNISIADYSYDLPNHKIAFEPLLPKDSSKLLVYKNHKIVDAHFTELADYLPSESLLVFNNSKVIPARLPFYTATNACIEIFLLEPVSPNNYEMALGIITENKCTWKCFVGNVKKWKDAYLLQDIAPINCQLKVSINHKLEDAFLIDFEWDAFISFADIIEHIGKIPLPPYIKRETVESDKVTYQTIYSKINGSVAAPTAGLHFTQRSLDALAVKNIATSHVTLHVGAGTFKPVKATVIADHPMHSEYFVIDSSEIQKIMNAHKIIAVGTTSCRTLESIYWLGIKLYYQQASQVLSLHQWEVYELALLPNISAIQAMQQLLDYCTKYGESKIECNTQILIAPGYDFKMVDVLITNFHQPNSTLLLLIAAFVGCQYYENTTNWQNIYDHALAHDYRFLSYGDSSVLFR